MRLFRPKRGPVLTQGRVTHLLGGVLVPIAASQLWGYEGLGISGVFVVAAFGWEAASVQLGKRFKWPHKFGDVIDLIAFVVGWCAGAVIGLVGR